MTAKTIMRTYSGDIEVEVTDLPGAYVCYDNRTTVIVRIVATGELTNVHPAQLREEVSA